MSRTLLERRDLVPGRLVRRYQRFLADVELADGSLTTAHCTNTGTMKTCWAPGDLVLLAASDNPARKLKYTWVACHHERTWIGVETGIPNKVVAEAARRDVLPGCPGLREVRTEVKYGSERSRIDVWARDVQGREVFIEVKNSTLKVGDWVCFPDAVTERGRKHLRELQAMVQEGHRGVIAFFLHRHDIQFFDAAREIDPAYAEALELAAASGVEVLPLAVHLRATEQEGRWTLGWEVPGLLPWKERTGASMRVPLEG